MPRERPPLLLRSATMIWGSSPPDSVAVGASQVLPDCKRVSVCTGGTGPHAELYIMWYLCCLCQPCAAYVDPELRCYGGHQQLLTT